MQNQKGRGIARDKDLIRLALRDIVTGAYVLPHGKAA